MNSINYGVSILKNLILRRVHVPLNNWEFYVPRFSFEFCQIVGVLKLRNKKKKKLSYNWWHLLCIYIYIHQYMLFKINTVNPMWSKSHFDHSQFHMYCLVACLMLDILVWHIIHQCWYWHVWCHLPVYHHLSFLNVSSLNRKDGVNMLLPCNR